MLKPSYTSGWHLDRIAAAGPGMQLRKTANVRGVLERIIDYRDRLETGAAPSWRY